MATCQVNEAWKSFSSAGTLKMTRVTKMTRLGSPHPTLDVESPASESLQSTAENPEMLSLGTRLPGARGLEWEAHNANDDEANKTVAVVSRMQAKSAYPVVPGASLPSEGNYCHFMPAEMEALGC